MSECNFYSFRTLFHAPLCQYRHLHLKLDHENVKETKVISLCLHRYWSKSTLQGHLFLNNDESLPMQIVTIFSF